MIIKGGARSSGGFFANHLMKAEDNERVDVTEIRGLLANNVRDAFHEMRMVAAGTRAENYFYHASINPREDEQLTPEQWDIAVDTLEKNLGLTDHARFQVEHEKNGRTHRHIVWSRVDLETMTVTPASGNYLAHDKTRLELEREFQHEPTAPTPQPSQRRSREFADWENFRSQDSGISPAEMKAEITALWQQSDSGRAFQAAIEENGYLLAKGDRRDFVLIDPEGDIHSLARRIDGAKAADIRAKMGDLDRDSLMGAKEASAAMRARSEAGSTGGIEAVPATSEESLVLEKSLADPPGRNLEHLIPPTYPAAKSAQDHADLTEAVMRSTQAELPHSRHTWQDWAAQAWDTLRTRTAELAERVKDSASSFWQDLVKDQLPPAAGEEKQSPGHWRQLFGETEPPDDIIHKEPELER